MPTDLLLALLLCGPTLVERVLAVAGGRPVLLSETKAVAEVRGVTQEAALELLLDETLMYDQTLRTPQAAVSPAEVEAAREDLYAKRPELRTRVARGDLTRLLRRQIAILRYVDFRFRPQVRPTDAELQEAYAAEYAGRPDAPPF